MKKAQATLSLWLSAFLAVACVACPTCTAGEPSLVRYQQTHIGRLNSWLATAPDISSMTGDLSTTVLLALSFGSPWVRDVRATQARAGNLAESVLARLPQDAADPMWASAAHYLALYALLEYSSSCDPSLLTVSRKTVLAAVENLLGRDDKPFAAPEGRLLCLLYLAGTEGREVRQELRVLRSRFAEGQRGGPEAIQVIARTLIARHYGQPEDTAFGAWLNKVDTPLSLTGEPHSDVWAALLMRWLVARQGLVDKGARDAWYKRLWHATAAAQWHADGSLTLSGRTGDAGDRLKDACIVLLNWLP